MLDIYWGCLIGGVIFGAISLVFGDLIGDAIDGAFDAISADSLDFLHPMVIVGAITVFGGLGILLTKYTSFAQSLGILIAAGSAVVFSILIFFVYVKPMKNTEASIAFSMNELVGKTGQITVPVPHKGYGEVKVKIGLNDTYQIAAAFDKDMLESGQEVVVVEVRDGTLYVSPIEL